MDVTMTADPPNKGGGAFVAFKEMEDLQAKQRAASSAAPASPGTSPGGSRVRLFPRFLRCRERRRHERARGPARAPTNRSSRAPRRHLALGALSRSWSESTPHPTAS